MNRITVPVSFLTLLLTVSCITEDDLAGIGYAGYPFSDDPPPAALRATIDGQAFTASMPNVEASAPRLGAITIIASDATRRIELRLGNVQATGTYELGVDPMTSGGGTGSVIFRPSARDEVLKTWATPIGGVPSGDVTFTVRTEWHIQGTFKFRAVATDGSFTPRERVVMSGSFDIHSGPGLPLVASAPAR